MSAPLDAEVSRCLQRRHSCLLHHCRDRRECGEGRARPWNSAALRPDGAPGEGSAAACCGWHASRATGCLVCRWLRTGSTARTHTHIQWQVGRAGSRHGSIAAAAGAGPARRQDRPRGMRPASTPTPAPPASRFDQDHCEPPLNTLVTRDRSHQTLIRGKMSSPGPTSAPGGASTLAPAVLLIAPWLTQLAELTLAEREFASAQSYENTREAILDDPLPPHPALAPNTPPIGPPDGCLATCGASAASSLATWIHNAQLIHNPTSDSITPCRPSHPTPQWRGETLFHFTCAPTGHASRSYSSRLSLSLDGTILYASAGPARLAAVRGAGRGGPGKPIARVQRRARVSRTRSPGACTRLAPAAESGAEGGVRYSGFRVAANECPWRGGCGMLCVACQTTGCLVCRWSNAGSNARTHTHIRQVASWAGWEPAWIHRRRRRRRSCEAARPAARNAPSLHTDTRATRLTIRSGPL